MKPELYEKHYEFEWNHRTYLSSAQNVPIGVMSLLGGALTILIQKFPYGNNLETIIYVALISISILLFAIAIYFLFRAIIGYEYKRVATPLKLKEHYEKLLEWWQKHGDGGEAEAQKDLEEFVYQKMAEATEVNAKNNRDKSHFLYKTNKFLAISFLFLALSAIPYLFETINKDESTYKVDIVKPIILQKEVVQMADQDRDTTQRPPKSDPPPPKPEGPPNENIREDVLPTTIQSEPQKR